MTPIDAVLVAYRSEAVIAASVEAAAALGGRVVVVDHGDGASARRARDLGAVVQEDASNPGFGTGQNRGVALTSTEFVLLCNPDALIDPDAVAAGAAFLREHPEVAAVQGAIVNRLTGRLERSQGVELGPVHLLGRAVGAGRLAGSPLGRAVGRRCAALRDHVERARSAPTEVESLAATTLLVRRRAFDEVGGFDESHFLYGEDLDLCRRLRRAGWALVALPEAWAVHDSGGSADSSWLREYHWWRGTMRFATRWWGAGAWALAMASATIASARMAFHRPRMIWSVVAGVVIAPVAERLRRRAAFASGPPARSPGMASPSRTSPAAGGRRDPSTPAAGPRRAPRRDGRSTATSSGRPA